MGARESSPGYLARRAQITADEVSGEVFGGWTAYSPGLISTAGTITSLFGTPAGQFKLLGKACIFWCAGVINLNGTGSGEVIMAIPKPLTSTTLQTQLVPVRIAPASAALVSGLGMPAGNNIQFRINKYDGTYPGGDGFGIYMSGTYQWTL